MNNCLIQVTNSSIGAVAINEVLPLGVVTLNTNCNCNQNQTLVAKALSNIEQIEINKTGKYKISYMASFIANAAGTVTVNLVVNNVIINSISAAVAANTALIVPLEYVLSVTNKPAIVKLTLGDIALTGGTSNFVVEQI